MRSSSKGCLFLQARNFDFVFRSLHLSPYCRHDVVVWGTTCPTSLGVVIQTKESVEPGELEGNNPEPALPVLALSPANINMISFRQAPKRSGRQHAMEKSEYAAQETMNHRC